MCSGVFIAKVTGDVLWDMTLWFTLGAFSSSPSQAGGQAIFPPGLRPCGGTGTQSNLKIAAHPPLVKITASRQGRAGWVLQLGRWGEPCWGSALDPKRSRQQGQWAAEGMSPGEAPVMMDSERPLCPKGRSEDDLKDRAVLSLTHLSLRTKEYSH